MDRRFSEVIQTYTKIPSLKKFRGFYRLALSKCGFKVHYRRERLVFSAPEGRGDLHVVDYLFITDCNSFNKRGAEALVLHLVQAGDGAALGRGDLVDLLLRVGVMRQQQLSGAFDRLGSDQGSGLGVEADLDAALDIGPDIAHRVSSAAGSKHGGGVHELFFHHDRKAQLGK